MHDANKLGTLHAFPVSTMNELYRQSIIKNLSQLDSNFSCQPLFAKLLELIHIMLNNFGTLRDEETLELNSLAARMELT